MDDTDLHINRKPCPIIVNQLNQVRNEDGDTTVDTVEVLVDAATIKIVRQRWLESGHAPMRWGRDEEWECDEPEYVSFIHLYNGDEIEWVIETPAEICDLAHIAAMTFGRERAVIKRKK